MDPEDDDSPLPNTDILERVQALLVEAREELRLVALREYTREQNIAAQRARRQLARMTKAPPVLQPQEALELTGSD